MNVEATTLPSDVTGESRPSDRGEGVSGIGDFTTALRGAIGEDGSAEAARSNSETSGEAEQETTERGTNSDTRADQDDTAGNAPEYAKGNAAGTEPEIALDVLEESTAEELIAGSAQAAADTGALGVLLGGPQTAAREGAGLSDSNEAEGASSVLDSNRREAQGGRATLPVEDDSTMESPPRRIASNGADSQAGSFETGVASAPNSETAERRAPDAAESELRSAEVVSSAAQVGNEALNGVVEGNGERGAEVAATPTTPPFAEAPVSREDNPSVRADAGTGEESASQGDREGSNESRNPSEQQAASDQRPSVAEQEVQAGVAAAAAAAYTATAASGNLRADESVAVESGVAVAGTVAVTAPETVSAPTAPTANAPQPAAASDAIAVQTEWLATRGGGSARLRLNPVELGEIEIRVSLRGGVVNVVMVAQEAATQTLAEEQSERLTQAFANRDLRMDSFDVRRGDPNTASNDASGEFAQSSQQGENRNEQNGQASGGNEGAAVGQTGIGSASNAPVMPQILTTGPEASVDLRI